MQFFIQPANDLPVPIPTSGMAQLIQHPKSQLLLSVTGLADEQIEHIQLDTPTGIGAFSRNDASDWQIDLTSVLPTTSVTPVTVILTTAEAEPQIFRRQLKLQRRPLAPILEADFPTEGEVIRQPKITLKARIRPATTPLPDPDNLQVEQSKTVPELALEPVVIELVGQQGSVELQRFRWEVTAATDLQQEVNLPEGASEWDWHALNRDALPTTLAMESVSSRQRLVYSPFATDPPTIRLAVTPAAQVNDPDGKNADLPAQLRQFDGRLLRMPQCTIQLLCTAKEDLESIKVRWDDLDLPLPKSIDPMQKSYRLELPMTVTPGPHRLSVQAKTIASSLVDRSLAVYYLPTLPHLTAKTEAIPSQLDWSQSSQVTVETTLQPLQWGDTKTDKTLAHLPYTISLWHNGNEVPANRVQLADLRGQATVTLTPGENRLQWVLRNEWGAERRSTQAIYYLRQTPRTIQVATSPPTAEPFTSLTITCESPNEKPPTKLTVNDRQELASEWQLQEGRWLTTVAAVPLQEGANRLRVRVANADGWSIHEATMAITYEAPPPPLATLEVLEPAAGAVFAEPAVPLRWLVRTSSPLREMIIERQGQPIHRWSAVELERLNQTIAKPQTAPASSPKTLVLDTLLKFDHVCQLRAGTNELLVRVVNAGGAVEQTVAVSYVPTPVRIILAEFYTPMEQIPIAPLQQTEPGLWVCEKPAPKSTIELVGRVQWSDAQAPDLKEELWLTVWCNGFRQIPVKLKPVDSQTTAREFRTRIGLNRAKDNQIHFELANVAEAGTTKQKLRLDCEEPLQDQQLHLLVIGPDEADQTSLTSRSLKALDITGTPPQKLECPAFPKVTLYGPLVQYVSPQKIVTQLELIRHALYQRARSGFTNDVVMVMYQGQQFKENPAQEQSQSKPNKFYLATSDTQFDPNLDRSAFSSEELERFVLRSPGAHLLFLEVITGDSVALESAEKLQNQAGLAFPENAGLLRYVWQRPEEIDEANRLLRVVEQAVSSVVTVGEVALRVQQVGQEINEHNPQLLIFERRLSPELSELKIGVKTPDH